MNTVKSIVCVAIILPLFCIMPALARRAPKASTNELPKAAASDASKPAAVETTNQSVQVKMPDPDSTEAKAAAPLSGDAVLVKVADKTVTQANLDSEISQIRQMMKNRGGSPQQFDAMLKNIKPQILEGLIVRKLIACECEREKIIVTPEETAVEVKSFEATLPKKISMDDFLKQNGITRETFERDISEQVKIEKLLKITPPTDGEIKSYYDENKKNYEVPETVSARHILVAVDAGDDAAKKEAKKKKAEDLRKQLDKGADFAKLAEENSDCPSKSKGGSLGEFPRGNMVPAFEQAAFSLKSNEISGVVETDFGYHIIQNIGHNEPRTVPFDDVKGQIAFRLKSKKVQEKLETLVEKLKSENKIEYTKDGESLKPVPRPMVELPMMPANEKDDKGAGKEKSKEEKSDKPAEKK